MVLRFVYIIAFIVLVVWKQTNAEAPRTLTWDDQVSVVSLIDDPLEGLTSEQGIELELLASIRAKQKLGMISDVDPKTEFAAELEHGFRKTGLDVEKLLDRYIKVQIAIKKQNASDEEMMSRRKAVSTCRAPLPRRCAAGTHLPSSDQPPAVQDSDDLLFAETPAPLDRAFSLVGNQEIL